MYSLSLRKEEHIMKYVPNTKSTYTQYSLVQKTNYYRGLIYKELLRLYECGLFSNKEEIFDKYLIVIDQVTNDFTFLKGIYLKLLEVGPRY